MTPLAERERELSVFTDVRGGEERVVKESVAP
jgi:hypothetical protein